MGRLISDSSTSPTSPGYVQGEQKVHVHASNATNPVLPVPNVNCLLHVLNPGTFSPTSPSNLMSWVELQETLSPNLQLLHVELGYLDQMIWRVQDPTKMSPGPGHPSPSSSTLKTNKTRRARNANNAQGVRGLGGREDRSMGRVCAGVGSMRGQAGCYAAGHA